MLKTLYAALAAVLLWPAAALAQEGAVKPMNNARLDELIRGIDGIEGGIDSRPGAWLFVYRGHQVYVITDENADRMRIMVPVVASDTLRKDVLFRMMQANFDTALDARYAIASDTLWSVFLHPLSPLTEAQFQSGFVQSVTLAATFGTDYSSGALRFGGGDGPAQ